MTWDTVKIHDLLTDFKTLTVKMAWALSRRLSLAQPIDGYLDDFYFMCNATFAIEEGSSNFEDVDFDYLYSIYTKMLVRHNRYKGLNIPAHHDAH